MRAAVYCRVSSSEQQDNSSLATQEQSCRRYAQERGWTVVAVYADVHTGAELFERPQLTLLREAMRRGEFEVLLVHALDRLSRKQTHQGLILSEAEHAGVRWDSATEDVDDSPQGQILRAVIGGMAEMERLKIAERTSRGRRARVESGKPLPGPRPPYGYLWTNSEKAALVTDDVTSLVVRRVFEEAAAGIPIRRIAARLTGEGIASPTGQPRWSASTVHGLLKRPEYAGSPTGLRTRFERLRDGKVRNVPKPSSEQISLPLEAVPPIVPRSLFEAVQVRLEKNKAESTRNNRNPQTTLLRAGFARCGYCGNTMVVQRSKRAGELYSCSSRNRDLHNCPYFPIKASILDSAVWSLVESVILRPEIVETELERRYSSDPSSADLASVRHRLREVAKGQDRLSRAIASIDDEMVVDSLLVQLKTLAKQRRELETEENLLFRQQEAWKASQGQLREISTWCEQARGRLDSLSYEDRRDLLSALGVEVRVFQRTHMPRYEVAMCLDGIVSSSS